MNSSWGVQIKTLTPLWTGDANRNCETLKETGIIGSLRWWYEVIVRGLGGYACDPTSSGKCELSGKEKTDKERVEKLCPVCYLFGCGGWKRRFRLEAANEEQIPFQLATLSKKGRANYDWISKIFEKSLNSNQPYGEVKLNFKQFKNDEVRKQIEALISIMAHVGAIGAKTQFGFGQFDWENKMGLKESLIRIQEFLDANIFKECVNNPKWYSLNNFWFYELTPKKGIKKFQNNNINFIGSEELNELILPVSFDIRYKIPGKGFNGLREYYNENWEENTNTIFGTTKLGSKVFVSHIFRKKEDYTIRIWGFTEGYVGERIGKGLKDLLDLEKLPTMLTGKELCRGVKDDI